MIITGNKVELHRMKKGWSQRDLSEKTGINTAVISQIERGKRKPQPRTAFRICEALEVDFEELFFVEIPGRKEAQ